MVRLEPDIYKSMCALYSLLLKMEVQYSAVKKSAYSVASFVYYDGENLNRLYSETKSQHEKQTIKTNL